MKSKHEVLIGPYRSGKSWQLLEKALEHCRSQKNLNSETLIIVPSQRYRNLIEKRIYKKSNPPGLWGLKILTFDQFCRNSLLKAGVFLKNLPDAARPTLVSTIGRQLLKEGKIDKLAPVINFSGTQASILSLIDEWQAMGYRANQALKQIKEKETNGHHIELAQIYSQYVQTLQQNNYADEHGLMFKLIDLLMSADKVNYVNDFIIVDGFDRWHILQLQLLKALCKHVPEIHVSFDYEQPGDHLLEEYAWKEKSYEQLKELLDEKFKFEQSVKNALVGVDCIDPRTRAQQASPLQTTPEVFCAGDRLAEAAIIAARVKAAIVLDGVKPDEIVVTARDLGIYKPAFEAAFQDAGLDYYLDQSIDLSALPIIHFLLDLLSLSANDFKRRQVIDCLRSSYFNLNNFGLTTDDVELLNEQSLEEKINVVSGRKQWRMAAKGNLKLAANLMKFFDTVTPPRIASAIEYATWVEDLIVEVMNLNSVHDDGIEAINQFRRTLAHMIEEENVLNNCFSVGARSTRPRVDAIAPYKDECHSEIAVPTMKLAIHEEPAAAVRHISYAERVAAETKTHIGAKLASPFEATANFYHQHLVESITKSNFPSSSPSANKVLITGAAFVPNEKFKQIYVAGMLEGEFPTHNPGSGFLTPEELAQWQRLGIPVYDPRLEPGFEYSLFASLINRAEEKITFSYPNSEITSSKEEPVASFFLSSLDLVNESKTPESFLFESFFKTVNSNRNAAAYCLWHQIPLSQLSNKHPQLFDFVRTIEKKLDFAKIRSQALSPGHLAGYLVDHVTDGTIKINLPEYWSASQMNEYGKCPFSYWVTRALKLKVHSEPEAGLFAKERGSYYHKVLELFYKEVIARKLAINVENEKALLALFEQAISDATVWLEKENWFQPTEFWPQEKADLSLHLRNFFAAEYKRFLKEGGQFIPYMVEAEFGSQPSQEPLVLSKGGQTIKFRGKIDRIDIEASASRNTGEDTGALTGAPSGLRIIDYKSGSSLPTGSDFESGRNIQLPLYALAAEQALLPGSRAEAYSYLSIHAGKANGEEGAVLRTYLNVLPDKIWQFVEAINSGDFSLKPSNANVCKSCEHQRVCRVKEFPQSLDFNQDQSGREYNSDD